MGRLMNLQSVFHEHLYTLSKNELPLVLHSFLGNITRSVLGSWLEFRQSNVVAMSITPTVIFMIVASVVSRIDSNNVATCGVPGCLPVK